MAIAIRAEQYSPDAAVDSLMKLRQFGEMLAQQIAARTGVFTTMEKSQAELLARLRREGSVPRDVLDVFHDLRRRGNDAAHAHQGDHAEALAALRLARQLAIFFHRTFGDPKFKPGPFQPPRPPADATAELQSEIERLRAERDALQQSAAAFPPAAQQTLGLLAFQAAEALDRDEASTRDRIDAQLRARGWEADSRTLRYAPGARPAKGRNMAIAEWPASSGPADYELFCGLTCVGVVEAKRRNRNVAAALGQAGRYAQGLLPEAGIELPAGGPWSPDSRGQEPAYRLPFLFSANGRGYLKRIETQSGIWFRDARAPTNQGRGL